jgi:hypothetical protein
MSILQRWIWILALAALGTSACGTTVQHQRVTLSDVDRELGQRFQGEQRLNGLHPAHTPNQSSALRISWVDFCHTKECGSAEMKYTRLSREVGITAATVSQLRFVVDQIEAGRVRGQQAEPFLELGWRELPSLSRRIDDQREALEALDPDADFEKATLRSDGWDAIALAATQLENAERQLNGLDQTVAELYRQVEPRFQCPEPEPVDGIVLTPTSELERQMERAEQLLADAPERPDGDHSSPEEIAKLLMRRGVKSLERDQARRAEREASASSRARLKRLEIDGPLDDAAARQWFDERRDALLECLPPEGSDAVELEALAMYSSEAVVSDVRVMGEAQSPDVFQCVSAAIDGTAVVGDIPQQGGSLRLTIALRPVSKQETSEPVEIQMEGSATP